jgi:hypothetical protein
LLAEILRSGSLGRESLLRRIGTFIDAYNTETARRLSSGVPALKNLESEWTEFELRMEALRADMTPAGLLVALSACIPSLGASRTPAMEADRTMTA